MFLIRLDATKTSNAFSILSSSFNEGMDSRGESPTLMGLLASACDVLADTGSIFFQVGGFGQARWPVDVRTDLLVLLEQLQHFLGWLDLSLIESDAFELDFYEQGIQRLLTFRKTQTVIEVSCSSQTKWQPRPKLETIAPADLEKSLKSLVETFHSSIEQFCPSVYKEELYREWLTNLCA